MDGPATGLEDGLQRFFLFVAQTALQTPISFPENGKISKYPSDPVVILDPVNSENNVAMRLQDSERQEIVAKATVAWETISAASWKSGKGDTLELWKQVFGRSFVIEE